MVKEEEWKKIKKRIQKAPQKNAQHGTVYISKYIGGWGKFAECCMAPVRLATTFRQGTIFADIAIKPKRKNFLSFFYAVHHRFLYNFFFDTFIYSFEDTPYTFSFFLVEKPFFSINWLYCDVWKLIVAKIQAYLNAYLLYFKYIYSMSLFLSSFLSEMSFTRWQLERNLAKNKNI